MRGIHDDRVKSEHPDTIASLCTFDILTRAPQDCGTVPAIMPRKARDLLLGLAP